MCNYKLSVINIRFLFFRLQFVREQFMGFEYTLQGGSGGVVVVK